MVIKIGGIKFRLVKFPQNVDCKDCDMERYNVCYMLAPHEMVCDKNSVFVRVPEKLKLVNKKVQK